MYLVSIMQTHTYKHIVSLLAVFTVGSLHRCFILKIDLLLYAVSASDFCLINRIVTKNQGITKMVKSHPEGGHRYLYQLS